MQRCGGGDAHFRIAAIVHVEGPTCKVLRVCVAERKTPARFYEVILVHLLSQSQIPTYNSSEKYQPCTHMSVRRGGSEGGDCICIMMMFASPFSTQRAKEAVFAYEIARSEKERRGRETYYRLLGGGGGLGLGSAQTADRRGNEA